MSQSKAPWYNSKTNLNSTWWPTKISTVVKSITSNRNKRPEPSPFQFELSTEAAHKNFSVLRKSNFNLQRVIQANKLSPIGYGSEFRNHSTLAPLLDPHPRWHLLQNLLVNGSVWPMSKLNEDERQKDVDEALKFGNHKGASLHKETLRTLISDKGSHGYILPLPLSKITRIPGIPLSPLNIVRQKQ